MPQKPAAAAKGAQPTQKFLAIDQIRDDVVLLKDGSMRSVLMSSSVNFALKSSEEQEATIYQFQNFLNSLDFSLQIVIHSRKMKIDDYLAQVKEKEKAQTDELLRVQTAEYYEFIKSFVAMTSIMSKTFYAIVPYSPATAAQAAGGGLFAKFMGGGKTAPVSDSAEKFGENKNQLWQRVEAVRAGMNTFGIRSAPLKTEELIELFFGLYNPEEAAKGKVPGITELK